MIEYHIHKYLADEDVIDGNGYVAFRPDTNDTMLSIYSETAPPQQDTHHFDSDMIGVHILFRGENTQEVVNLARKTHRTISGLGSLEITHNGETVNIVDTNVQTPPSFLERDEKNRVEMTAHYYMRVNIGGNLYRKMDRTYNPAMVNPGFPYILDFEL